MHKYKIKRNHKQKLRYKFQFIHKTAILLTIWHIFTQIRPYELHSPENSVKMVAVPKDNLPIFTKKQETC